MMFKMKVTKMAKDINLTLPQLFKKAIFETISKKNEESFEEKKRKHDDLMKMRKMIMFTPI